MNRKQKHTQDQVMDRSLEIELIEAELDRVDITRTRLIALLDTIRKDTPATKREHWTQTPEGKRKLGRQSRKAWKKRSAAAKKAKA